MAKIKTIQDEMQELAEAKAAFAEKASSMMIDYREGDDEETRTYNSNAALVNEKIYDLTVTAETKFQAIIDEIGALYNLVN